MQFFRASLSTTNFSFEALDESKGLAIEALHRGLREHAQQYHLKPDWYRPFLGEIQTNEFLPGSCYRDRELIRVAIRPDAQRCREVAKKLSAATLGGHTEEQLREAFAKVQDDRDWRNPVDALVDPSEVEILQYAIPFVTGSQPVFMAKGEMVRVIAAGRYAIGA